MSRLLLPLTFIQISINVYTKFIMNLVESQFTFCSHTWQRASKVPFLSPLLLYLPRAFINFLPIILPPALFCFLGFLTNHSCQPSRYLAKIIFLYIWQCEIYLLQNPQGYQPSMMLKPLTERQG